MSSQIAGCPKPDGEAFGCDVAADPQLVAEGWVRRHLVDARRAEESVELYTAMGFEVRVETVTPRDFSPQCSECAQHICPAYVMVYTRRSSTA